MLKEAADADDDETIKWAIRCNKSAQGRKEMLDVVKDRTAVRMDAFDADPWLLGVENGVVDLYHGRARLRPAARCMALLRPVSWPADQQGRVGVAEGPTYHRTPVTCISGHHEGSAG
jgi:hypothetical protein